jgi:hypothetical protein
VPRSIDRCQLGSLKPIVSVLVIAFSIFLLLQVTTASADVGPYASLPPANIGNRNASLFVRIDPPFLLASANEPNSKDVTILLRLFDANNNQTISYTTYLITVTKGIEQNQRPLLTDFFQAPNGLLAVKIHPTSSPVQIYGNQEPYLNAWVADPGGKINVQGPIFLEGGLYHFHIEIFGIDNARNIFIPSDAPTFDTYLHVGDFSNHNLQYDGVSYNSTLISYFDKVSNFSFDSTQKKISWSMPFDWNSTILRSSNAFLHQELRIPKSLHGLGDAKYFNATANGFLLQERMLAMDPYSYENDLTLHYLLNKDDLISMSKDMPAGTDTIDFTLTPVANATIRTTGEVTTQTGGISVQISWNPSQPIQTNGTVLTLNFSDSAYGGSLKANIKYDLSVLNENSTEVFSKTNLIAINGTDHQSVTFPANGIYHIQISVKELDRPGQVPDWTRNGTARGIVVVPEFGPLVALMMAVTFALAIVISRKAGYRLAK